MRAECYNVVSTSLVACLPDLSLVQGCCTRDCSTAIRLVCMPHVFARCMFLHVALYVMHAVKQILCLPHH